MKALWTKLAIITLIITSIFSYFYFKPKTEKYILSPIGQITDDLTTKDNFYDIISTNNFESKNKRKKITNIKRHCTHIKKGAWVPYWAYNSSVKSINQKDFAIVSPVVFQLDKDGNLFEPKQQAYLQLYKSTSKKIYPTFSTFDPDRLKLMLTKHQEETINTLVNHVTTYNLAGIDIDIESIYVEDKEEYFAFLNKLAKELHKHNAKLSITVLPKWGEGIEYETLPETRESQDYQKIGEIADSVRIMAYDYTSTQKKTPGPIAPIFWVKEVVQYAVQYIPQNKLWLGISTYGYEWINHPQGEVTVGAYQWRQINQIIKDPTVKVSYDPSSGESIATYNCLKNSHCVMYFTTPTHIKKRIDIAKDFCLEGVFFWSIDGKEGDIF